MVNSTALAAVSPQQWMILGAFGLIAVAVLFARARRRPLDAPPRASSRLDVAQQSGVEIRDDMERLMTELCRLSDSIDKQLDGKLGELKCATAEADQRISALRILVQAARTASVVQAPAAPRPSELDDPRARKIYQLADEGLTLLQIAQRLGEPPGEVELILNLRGIRHHAS